MGVVNLMPEISLFYGIKITMNWNDHVPPHFHAECSTTIPPIPSGIVPGSYPHTMGKNSDN